MRGRKKGIRSDNPGCPKKREGRGGGEKVRPFR